MGACQTKNDDIYKPATPATDFSSASCRQRSGVRKWDAEQRAATEVSGKSGKVPSPLRPNRHLGMPGSTEVSPSNCSGSSQDGEQLIGSYRVSKMLGKGGFSTVRVAIDTKAAPREQSKWAMKIINRKHIEGRENRVEMLKREWMFTRTLNHPHIIAMQEAMITPTHVCFVLELCEETDLCRKIIAAVDRQGRPSREFRKGLDTATAQHYYKQLLLGLAHCHKHRIVHHDIKPENLLIDANDNIKISDFGLAEKQVEGQLLTSSVGTPDYIAPEVLRAQPYDGFKSDIWSCGVVLFCMLGGFLPFAGKSKDQLYNTILNGNYSFTDKFSTKATALISKILNQDPHMRPSLHDISCHPWFDQHSIRAKVVNAPRAEMKHRRRTTLDSAPKTPLFPGPAEIVDINITDVPTPQSNQTSTLTASSTPKITEG